MVEATGRQGILLVLAASLLPGCANLIYSGGTQVGRGGPGGYGTDNGYCSSSAPNLWDVYREQVRCDSPYSYLVVDKITTRTFCNDVRILLLGMTPLGVIGPLFDYPHKEEVYSGTITLSTNLLGAIQKSFETSAETTVTIDFNSSFDDAIKKTGHAVRYSPESVSFTINCSGTKCSASAPPAGISSDGSITLAAETVVDEARVNEIAQEEAEAHRRAQEEQRRAQQVEEDKRRKARERYTAPPPPCRDAILNLGLPERYFLTNSRQLDDIRLIALGNLAKDPDVVTKLKSVDVDITTMTGKLEAGERCISLVYVAPEVLIEITNVAKQMYGANGMYVVLGSATAANRFMRFSPQTMWACGRVPD
jgi:hypothetical protein